MPARDPEAFEGDHVAGSRHAAAKIYVVSQKGVRLGDAGDKTFCVAFNVEPCACIGERNLRVSADLETTRYRLADEWRQPGQVRQQCRESAGEAFAVDDAVFQGKVAKFGRDIGRCDLHRAIAECTAGLKGHVATHHFCEFRRQSAYVLCFRGDFEPVEGSRSRENARISGGFERGVQPSRRDVGRLEVGRTQRADYPQDAVRGPRGDFEAS